MTDLPDLEPAANAVKSLVPGVAPQQLDDPTPCEKLQVRDLLFHLLGLSLAFRDAARKNLGSTTSTPPNDIKTDLPDDWQDQLPARLDDLVSAWRDPSAWQGQTQAGGVTLPGGVAGQLALNELVLHGWDLARATGQPYAVPDDSLQVSVDLLSSMQDASQRQGIFGPVVEVPSESSLLERTVGLGGRQPDWQPAG